MLLRYHTRDKKSREGGKTAKKLYQSTIDATRRYAAKTYKQITIILRKEEDADIIEDREKARRDGVKNREWLREMYEAKKNK